MMEIELAKWGNSLGIRIPNQVAKSFGLDEQSIVEMIEEKDSLIIKKKNKSTTLDELLESIPADFSYPDDVLDFVDSEPQGREQI